MRSSTVATPRRNRATFSSGEGSGYIEGHESVGEKQQPTDLLVVEENFKGARVILAGQFFARL